MLEKIVIAGGLLWQAGSDFGRGAYSYGAAGLGVSSRAGARVAGELTEKLHISCETTTELFKRAAHYAAPIAGAAAALSKVEIAGLSSYPIKVSLNSHVDNQTALTILGLAVGIQFASVISKMVSEQCHHYAGINLERVKEVSPPPVPQKNQTGKKKDGVAGSEATS